MNGPTLLLVVVILKIGLLQTKVLITTYVWLEVIQFLMLRKSKLNCYRVCPPSANPYKIYLKTPLTFMVMLFLNDFIS